MKRALWIAGAVAATLTLAACKRDDVSPKVIETLPPDVHTVVLPGVAAQQYLMLKRDSMNGVIPIINELPLAHPVYPVSLSGPDSSQKYSFPITDPHYGSAVVVIQFFSGSTPIDPIATQASTATLSSVAVEVTGDSARFHYHEVLTLTLDNPGNLSTTLHLTGTSDFTNGATITYTMPAPGARATFSGVSSGSATGTGIDGAGLPTTISLTFSTDHDANGSITWEDRSGGIHLAHNGPGFIVTQTERIFIE
jgi:hypothetical protein